MMWFRNWMSNRSRSAGLRLATRRAKFVLVNPETERAIAWRGGDTLCLYDLGGKLLEAYTVRSALSPAAMREEARRLLGKGDVTRLG